METSKQAAQKNMKAVVCKAYLNTFAAILILTGFHSLPQTRMFWEEEKDADVDNLNTNNKFAKVKKFYDITNTTLQQFGYFHC